MTYRFAFAAFWAAAAVAKVQLDSPLNLGAVKGLLLRHLRWWADEDRSGMFHADGTVNIGFVYPNMYMAEDYNSPQSPYWCLKTFIILALPETDDFWLVKEEENPAMLASSDGSISSVPEATIVWPPRQIIINDPFHHYLLSSGQSTKKTFKAREAKYGKFAYSSAFGFSVPTGPLLHQTAPDSTLAVLLGHDDSWKVRSSPQNVRLRKITIGGSEGHITGLTSSWKPRSHLRSFEVETTLIPPLESLPGWHVRVHRVIGSSYGHGTKKVSLVDGGFAIASHAKDGRFIPELREWSWSQDGWIADSADDGGGALVSSQAGTSGIVDLGGDLLKEKGRLESLPGATLTAVMRPDPNTNLIAARTMIPFVRHDLELSGDQIIGVFVTGVFAVNASEGLSKEKVRELWRTRPRVKVDVEGELEVTAVCV